MAIFDRDTTALSACTLATYRSRLSRLAAAVGTPTVRAAISRGKAGYAALQKAGLSVVTRKNMLVAVSAVLSRSDAYSAAAAAAWKSGLRSLCQLAAAAEDDNRVSPAMRKKLIDVAEARRVAADIVPRTRRDSLDKLLMRMTVDIPPKRADLGDLRVAARDTPSGNCIVLPRSGAATLVLRDYKTAKAFGEFRETLPDELTRDLRDSLRDYPREHVFVGRDNGPLSAAAFGEAVKATFRRRMGVAAGVNSIRHAYISQFCVPGVQTTAELKRIAASMNHGVAMQTRYHLVGL